MRNHIILIALLCLLLASCSLEDKHREAKLKRQNQTGELIERKEEERKFLAPRPKASSPPVYPWSSRFQSGVKISLPEGVGAHGVSEPIKQ